MKKPGIKKSVVTPAPVTPQTPHTLWAAAKDEKAKGKKRANIFSQSRDTREDRGTREMKTSHSAQSLPHGP
jgi:hypothetical protein